MAVRTLNEETGVFYFCTFTNYKWIPLFRITNFYDEIYRWFEILKRKHILTTGYVIMPNHLHCILFLPPKSQTINSIIGIAKRFMAYEIIDRLQKLNEVNILYKLGASVTKKQFEKGYRHKVFEPSFDSKPCYTDIFINEKLIYMHNNPVGGKWNLSQTPEDYIHSSARFYASGFQGVFSVTHYQDIAEEYLRDY